MFRRSVSLLLATICPLLLGGCGRGSRLETATVTGTVTLDGKPLTIGAVVFTPERGRAATGRLQSDGTYALGTYRSHDGAVLGKHLVAVIAREETSGGIGRSAENLGAWVAPQFYSDFTKSGLTFEVKSDGSNVYDIQLSSSAKPAQPP
jgi:hypothetical protein